jgi:hypothetical protein
MEIEVVIIGALVVFMLSVAIFPALLRSMRGGEKKAKKEKRGVAKSQMCLQPGCLRCAFSTDPTSLQAFKRHLWESFRTLAQNDLQDDDQRRTIHSRVGPAIKQLVSSPSAGSAAATINPAPSLLSLSGLASINLKRKRGEEDEGEATVAQFSWIDQLLPAIPRMADEARRLWTERAAGLEGEGRNMGKGWRKQEEGGGCTGWKWDLWNQGSFVEAHAQRAPETVQLLEQHAADDLMVNSLIALPDGIASDVVVRLTDASNLGGPVQKECAFGFAYLHAVEKEDGDDVASAAAAVAISDPDDAGLRLRNTSKSEERTGKNESDEKRSSSESQERRRRCGPTNARLRCRFVLSTRPDTSLLQVGATEEAKWEAGTCLVSDDSQPHELRAEPSGPTSEQPGEEAIALALVVDVWHPELAPIERQVLSKLFPASKDVSSSWLVD